MVPNTLALASCWFLSRVGTIGYNGNPGAALSIWLFGYLPDGGIFSSAKGKPSYVYQLNWLILKW